MNSPADRSSKTREDRTAELVDNLYSLTVDGVEYEEFMQSWGEVSAAWTADLNAHQADRSQREQQALLAHFRRAEEIFLRMGRKQDSLDDVELTIHNKSHPAIVVDASGTVIASNQALQDLVPERAERNTLSALVAILMGRHQAAEGFPAQQMIGRAQSKLLLIDAEPCLLVSTPLPNGDLTMVDFTRARWHDDLETDLRGMFQLSHSEVAICHLLYEGYDVKEIAALRGRAEDTVRKQIKSIHAKTRCPKQPDFMRLLTGMLVMGQIGRPDQRINAALVNSRSLTLPDGRRLYYFYQQPDGEIRQTIVVAHGIASSSIFPRGFTDALLESGVAIVGVSRPGYGRSSPLPPEASPLDQFAEDLEHLLDHLQLDRVNLVSMQSGAMFSFAAAAKLKRRIDRMVCIAPILPLSTPEQISALPTGLKILARTKRFFPAFFPLMIESVLKRVDAGEVDVLYRTWYKGVPCDLGVVKDAEARPLLDSWLRFCGAQGGKAYIHDAGLAVSDWSAVVRDSSLPVLFIHGEGDQAVPVDVVRRFIDQHEHIEYHGVPQAGQLAIFVAPELIAQRTIEFLK